MPSPRRIDVHFHLIPSFYSEAVYAAGRGTGDRQISGLAPELALELMDASGVAVALTSLAQPGVRFRRPKRARARWRGAATTTPPSSSRAGPSASAPLRTVPMGSMRGRARRDRPIALDKLAIDGVSLFASYGEKFLGDPQVRPGAGDARRARCGGVRPPRTASLEQGIGPALAGLHDGVSVRHHARRGESHLLPARSSASRASSSFCPTPAALRPISPGGSRCRR